MYQITSADFKFERLKCHSNLIIFIFITFFTDTRKFTNSSDNILKVMGKI